MLKLLAVALSAALLAACGQASASSESAEIAIRHSRFDLAEVTVRAGVPVTFTLRNTDPIEHEWIVGEAATHDRHRTGTEPAHDTVAEEVTLPAYATRTTTVTFEEPGEYQFICHLPGHEAYGMRGTVRVVG